MPRSDINRDAFKAGQRITDSAPVRGEDLLGSPELRKQFTEAKARLRAKPLGKKSVQKP
jgi:hypothetical protein